MVTKELKEEALKYLDDHVNDWAYYSLNCFFMEEYKLSAENYSFVKKLRFKVVLDD